MSDWITAHVQIAPIRTEIQRNAQRLRASNRGPPGVQPGSSDSHSGAGRCRAMRRCERRRGAVIGSQRHNPDTAHLEAAYVANATDLLSAVFRLRMSMMSTGMRARRRTASSPRCTPPARQGPGSCTAASISSDRPSARGSRATSSSHHGANLSPACSLLRMVAHVLRLARVPWAHEFARSSVPGAPAEPD